jgi:hypothetical protein
MEEFTKLDNTTYEHGNSKTATKSNTKMAKVGDQTSLSGQKPENSPQLWISQLVH